MHKIESHSQLFAFGVIPNLLIMAGLLLVIDPAQAQTFKHITLVSPNAQRFGNFGNSVSDAGDVDKDGVPDVIVGASAEDGPGDNFQNAGHAYILRSKFPSKPLKLKSPNKQLAGHFGYSVSGAGDVNDDGITDVIVGSLEGRAYIFSGQKGNLLFELITPNPQSSSNFGYSVSGIGDVNQDGFADVIVGAPSEFPDPNPNNPPFGRSYVFSGHDGSLIYELQTFKPAGGQFGISVSGAGDVNQDGFVDVIVGAQLELPGGHAYIFSGQNGSMLFDLISPNDQLTGLFGASVSGAGDVNQDGFADLIVGAYLETVAGVQQAGHAYVFSGQDGSAIYTLESPNAEFGGYFGKSVSDVGDTNQDGFADVLVGAYNETTGPCCPGPNGRAYIFSGQDGSLVSEFISPNNADPNNGDLGYSVSGAGDINQDGFADVIVGALTEDLEVNLQDAGRAYIFVSRVR